MVHTETTSQNKHLLKLLYFVTMMKHNEQTHHQSISRNTSVHKKAQSL